MANAQVIARQLAACGQGRDKVLAHINPDEARMLAKMNGMSINPKTGLPQFGLFGSIGKAFSNLFGGGDNNVSDAGGLSAIQKQLAGQYSSGQLTSGDQQSLNQSVTSQDAALKQQFASAGLGNSSMLQNELGNVQASAVSQRQQLLNNYLNESLGIYSGAVLPSIQQQFAQNTQLFTDLGSILGSMPVGK